MRGGDLSPTGKNSTTHGGISITQPVGKSSKIQRVKEKRGSPKKKARQTPKSAQGRLIVAWLKKLGRPVDSTEVAKKIKRNTTRACDLMTELVEADNVTRRLVTEEEKKSHARIKYMYEVSA